ncbi:MAG: hypothetical protein QME46_02510 [Thermoanaerobacteraceae bacterium]|nr:hypothetical protein [Thermoanaerobacteraceae bacterium]
MAYPIFTDIASIAGRFLYLHEAFQVSSVTKRIYELWGERDTVKYATEKIISTMSDMGVISHGEKPGEYKRGRRIVVNDPEYKLFLVNSFMLATNKKTLQYDTIEDQYPLFPFKIDLAVHEVNESETVSLNRFDNQTFVVMK